MSDEALQKVEGGYILTGRSWKLVHSLLPDDPPPLTDGEGLLLITAHLAVQKGTRSPEHFEEARALILAQARKAMVTRS